MDRQDIDALLVGALYGELTPADEARLAAHLDSHPTDRGALDDLKSARQAVRESRIFDVQLDPPQAVSALLLQEAHRRAPKFVAAKDDAKDGWFARFTRSFIAHPAMAAAAMLVLVVGVAGTLYMKKGDQFAETAAPVSEVSVNEAPAADPAQGASGSAALVTGSGYQVSLEEGKAADAEQAEKPEPAKAAPKNDSASDRFRAQDKAKAAAPQKQATRGIAVETKRPMPKDLDERTKGGESTLSLADDDGFADGRASAGPRAGVAGGAPNAPAAAPQPAPPPPATTATTAPRADAKTTVAKEEAAVDPTLLAWAKSQHSQAQKAAADGKCQRAAELVVGIINRAEDYYKKSVVTDRALKNCTTYIAAERDREAERSGKARAQKRVNADEAAPAPSK